MPWPFKCSHPARSLFVDSGPELLSKDADFETFQITLYCINCRAKVPIKWAQCVGGVDAFLERGHKLGAPNPQGFTFTDAKPNTWV